MNTCIITGGATINHALNVLFPPDEINVYSNNEDKHSRKHMYGENSKASVLRLLCDSHMVW
jgi:hypothetical protein